MSWIAVGIAVVTSVAGSMQKESDENANMINKAQAFGIRKAGIESTTIAALATLIDEAKTIQDQTLLVETHIGQNQAAAEAQARVNAAAAGVAGASPDAVINETEITAAQATNINATNLTKAQRQLKLSFINTVLNADSDTGTLDTTVQDRTTQHMLAGVTAALNTANSRGVFDKQ